MKTILKVEELGLFILSIYLFSRLNFAWWVFPALLLLPDISMLGYVFNSKVGAFFYNLFHHKALAIAIGLMGIFLQHQPLMLAGIILFGHSAFDRIMGYGLKYETGFSDTHLGQIGKKAKG